MGTCKTERCALVVDIGGTLIRRPQHGPVRRALEWWGGRTRPGATAQWIAETILTGRTVDEVADVLALRLELTYRDRSELRALLSADGGKATVLPGAVELLHCAQLLGWRVIAASNAAAWSEPLPPELAALIDDVYTSTLLGPKWRSSFWEGLLVAARLDPRRTVVVGDNEESDFSAPLNAGLVAIPASERGPDLTRVQRLIAEVGEPPQGAVGLLGGRQFTWGGRNVLEAPAMASTVEHLTRARVSLQTSERRVRGIVFRRRAGAPLVTLRRGDGELPWLSWVVPETEARRGVIPRDLAAALGAADLNGIQTRTRRYLISMICEAKDPETRARRVTDILEYMQSVQKRGAIHRPDDDQSSGVRKDGELE